MAWKAPGQNNSLKQAQDPARPDGWPKAAPPIPATPAVQPGGIVGGYKPPAPAQQPMTALGQVAATKVQNMKGSAPQAQLKQQAMGAMTPRAAQQPVMPIPLPTRAIGQQQGGLVIAPREGEQQGLGDLVPQQDVKLNPVTNPAPPTQGPVTAAPVKTAQTVDQSQDNPLGLLTPEQERELGDAISANVLQGNYGIDQGALDAKLQSMDYGLTKQQRSDEQRLGEKMGAAGLGGSGMSVQGMGELASGKMQAMNEAEANLYLENQKMGMQDRLAQLQAGIALASKQGDWALQERLAKEMLDFQKQSLLLETALNTPEKLMSWLVDSGADSDSINRYAQAMQQALDAGDMGQLVKAITGWSANGKNLYYKGDKQGDQKINMAGLPQEEQDALRAAWENSPEQGAFEGISPSEYHGDFVADYNAAYDRWLAARGYYLP